MKNSRLIIEKFEHLRKPTAAFYALLSQVCLLGSMLVCHILQPWVVWSASGISNFGVYWPAVIPYTLGFGLSAGIYALAAHKFTISDDLPGQNRLRKLQFLISIVMVLVLVSTYPYQINDFFDKLHRMLGALLVLVQIYFSWELLEAGKKTLFNLLLFTLLPISSIMMIVDLLGYVPILPVGQVILVPLLVYYMSETHIFYTRKECLNKLQI